MKHSIFAKALAIFLAACMMVVGVVSAFGIALLSYLRLYNAKDYVTWQAEEVEDRSERLAYYVAERYCFDELSDLPEEVCLQFLNNWHEWDYEQWLGLAPDSYSYTIQNGGGTVLSAQGEDALKGLGYEYKVSTNYPVLGTEERYEDDWWVNGQHLYIAYQESPEFTVRVYMTPESIASYNGVPTVYITLLFGLRHWMIAALAGSVLIFVLCAVYLCCAAGRKAGSEEIRPGGLNRMPLDLYLAICTGAVIGLVYLAWVVLDSWVIDEAANVGALGLVALAGLVAAVIVVGYFFALVAQIKVGKAWWLRHTLIGMLCILIFKGLRFVFRAIGKLFSLLPMIWQYLLCAFGMGIAILITIAVCVNGSGAAILFFLFHTVTGCIGLVAYGGYALGTIFKAIKRMRQGELEQKVSTRFLFGTYRKAAEDLNSLAEAAKLSAEKQLKSERMRTELITNVSHDLKTPLTSIINYVDLLQKPHSPAEAEQYLEVLSRQGRQMKKLVDDLMEVSKAATGNVAVELRQLNAVEAVNQALGEYADRLSSADLAVIWYPPEQAMILADGKLTWRVLSNLLHNAVKYALPGTRVYVDMRQSQEQVQISLKNISREPLNMSAEELMERFVRGDTSRNTEGSGLGLNIAQSLMELQHGKLELTVDGDLFKVTLTFPATNIWVVEQGQ